MMEIFVWWAAPKTGRGELRCTCQGLGALLEIAPGLMRMLRLCAGNLATQNKVRIVQKICIKYIAFKMKLLGFNKINIYVDIIIALTALWEPPAILAVECHSPQVLLLTVAAQRMAQEVALCTSAQSAVKELSPTSPAASTH